MLIGRIEMSIAPSLSGNASMFDERKNRESFGTYNNRRESLEPTPPPPNVAKYFDVDAPQVIYMHIFYCL